MDVGDIVAGINPPVVGLDTSRESSDVVHYKFGAANCRPVNHANDVENGVQADRSNVRLVTPTHPVAPTTLGNRKSVSSKLCWSLVISFMLLIFGVTCLLVLNVLSISSPPGHGVASVVDAVALPHVPIMSGAHHAPSPIDVQSSLSSSISTDVAAPSLSSSAAPTITPSSVYNLALFECRLTMSRAWVVFHTIDVCVCWSLTALGGPTVHMMCIEFHMTFYLYMVNRFRMMF